MRVFSPLLSKVACINHGFFTREGGVSEGPFAFLNCGYGSGDNATHVEKNRFFIARTLGVDAKNLCTAYQTHSAIAIVADKPLPPTKGPEADALVTNVPGIAIGVLTADCLPILCVDDQAKVIAAIHAGWKGAIGGVIESAIAAMQTLGAKPEHIVAAIGPAIEQYSYEVGAEFRDRFVKEDAKNAGYFTDSARDGHFMFDLKTYAKTRLLQCGLAGINVLANDTCLEENRFFSYRRATLRNETAYGRQISAITLLSS